MQFTVWLWVHPILLFILMGWHLKDHKPYSQFGMLGFLFLWCITLCLDIVFVLALTTTLRLNVPG